MVYAFIFPGFRSFESGQHVPHQGAVRRDILLLVGPADHWVEELIRLVVEIGIDTFIYWPATDPVRQIGLFAAEIVPAVQKQVAGVRVTS